MLTANLMDWRRSVEDQFKFKPSIPTDSAEIAKVHAEIAMRRSALETELLNGARDLETLRAGALAKRRDAKQYQATYLAFRQAETQTVLYCETYRQIKFPSNNELGLRGARSNCSRFQVRSGTSVAFHTR